MAYNALPTSVTGDLWTAANHNTYIKDNFAAGVPDIFTAAGDLAYATGANAASPLALGDARDVLAVNTGATAPEWSGGIFGCSISATTDQTISAGVLTPVVFDTENYDTSALWSSTNTDEVLIPFDGVYMCSGYINFPAGVAGDYRYAYVGGTEIAIALASSTSECIMNFTYVNRFAAATDVYLSTKHSLTTAEYAVTYLGAST